MNGRQWRRGLATLALGVVASSAACSAGKDEPGTPVSDDQSAAEQNETGRIIVVEAYSNAEGNYFKPSEIEARRGDIVRFTLRSGVHNVNFLPDSNAGRTGLPPASDMLQLPGQTYDLKVSLDEGRYYFQCDPHAALGMIGYLEVED